MTDNPFTQRYQTTDTSELLDIIDSPADYQPLAVEAARLEIDNRQLTPKQLAEAKAKQNARRQDKADKQQKVKKIEDKVKSVGSSLADTFNPIQQNIPTTDKYIKLISLFIGGLFLYQLYKEFDLLMYMFSDSSAKFDFGMILYFLPLYLLPAAGLLLWFRKKLGWTLATIFFSYTAAGAIQLFYMELNREPSGIPALDNMFPATSPAYYIGTLLVFGGLTWTLCKENIRTVYQVDKRSMFIAIGVGISIVFLMQLAL